MSLVTHNHYYIGMDAEDFNKKLDKALSKLNKIMATLAELNTKVDALQSALDTEQEQIRTAIQTLQTTVDELRQNIADGGTAEERQALADKIDSVITDLQGTIEDTPAPEAEA